MAESEIILKRRIGPYSRPVRLRLLPRYAELLDELMEHAGGSPPATVRLVIERVACILLQCELMEARIDESGGLSPDDTACYLAWVNTASRLIRDVIGIKPAVERPKGLHEVLAKVAANATR
jgi:hypothetical protein